MNRPILCARKCSQTKEKLNWIHWPKSDLLKEKYIASVEDFNVDGNFFKVNGVFVKKICWEESLTLELTVAKTTAECRRGLSWEMIAKLKTFLAFH